MAIAPEKHADELAGCIRMCHGKEDEETQIELSEACVTPPSAEIS